MDSAGWQASAHLYQPPPFQRDRQECADRNSSQDTGAERRNREQGETGRQTQQQMRRAQYREDQVDREVLEEGVCLPLGTLHRRLPVPV